MATTIIGTAESLVAALKTAQPGDRILLEPGTYSDISIRSLTLSENVTISSRDPANPAILSGLNIRDSQGLSFTGLEFAVDPNSTTDNPFQIIGSRNVHLANLSVHGSMDGDPSDDRSAILIRNSSTVSVTDSEFQQLWNGLSLLDNDGVVVSGNRFHDLRTDGVRGGGTSNLQIVDNTFSDFFPVDGDHPDAIQLWTSNTTASAHDIVISGNLITRGRGEVMQGIFVRDGSDALPFENVVITGNIVVGGMYNGITVDGGRHVQISHNTVTGYQDMKSWIRIENVSSGIVSNNEAQQFLNIASAYQDIRNEVIGVVSDLAASALQNGTVARLSDRQAIATLDLPFSGDAGAYQNRPVGTAGPDILAPGAAGNAWIEGGAGDDQLQGGSAGDYLRGDAGEDFISGGAGPDDTNGNAGRDTIVGGEGDDWVVGGKDNDLLRGDEGFDVVYGNLGDDTCDGGSGADWVRGGQGDDLINGGLGDDFLSGDLGSDRLTGGGGSDTFNIVVGSGYDYVTDFAASDGDRVRVEDQGPYTVTQVGLDTVIETGGADRLVLVGVQASSLPAGWLFLA